MPAFDVGLTTGNFSRTPAVSHFVFRAAGRLRVPITGNYTFKLRADDGAGWYVDETPIIAFEPCTTGCPSTRTGHVVLTAGYHSVLFFAFQLSASFLFELSWESASLRIPTSLVPPAVFSRDLVAPSGPHARSLLLHVVYLGGLSLTLRCRCAGWFARAWAVVESNSTTIPAAPATFTTVVSTLDYVNVSAGGRRSWPGFPLNLNLTTRWTALFEAYLTVGKTQAVVFQLDADDWARFELTDAAGRTLVIADNLRGNLSVRSQRASAFLTAGVYQVRENGRFMLRA